MARLPTVGGDAGNWGEVLNDYLSQSHAADGSLKTDSVGAPQLKPSSVTSAALAPGAVTSAKIDKFGQAGGVATLDGSGKLPTTQLPSLSKTDVGLANVDNTADTAKPVSTAQQTALDAKLNAAEKGAASGVATLDVSSKLLETNIPNRLTSATLDTTYALKTELAIKVAASGDTTGATDKAAIQTAIDNATAAGGGEVRLVGNYWINGALVLKSGVHLVGEGWQRSVINLATGSNSRMLELPTTSPSPIYFGLRDIKFDGWKENQTAGDTAIYINLGSAPAGIAGCSVAFFQRVYVQYAFGHGFYIGGAVEGRFIDLFAYRCDNNGIRVAPASDRWFINCTTGQTKNDGVHIEGGSGDRWHACKSWESGKNAARGVQGPLTVVNSAAVNYYISGRNHRMIDCEAQDAAAEGYIIQTHNSKYIIHGDANMGAHLRLQQADNNDIDLLVGDGTGHGTITPAAVYMFDADSVDNKIRTTWDNYGNSTTSGIIGGVIHARNDIIIGRPDQVWTTAYALSITPDPVKGYVDVTLTGNTTIGNTLVDRRVPNMEFDVWLTQDAVGGRTVAWGTDYVGVTAAVTTANTVNKWRFRCRLGKWYQISFTTY